jgi:hypothetical protein
VAIGQTQGLMLRAPPRRRAPERPFLHANLSPMLPQLPAALHPEFAAEFSQSGTAVCSADKDSVDHHCQICPTCGYKLTGHRCKLVCMQCGYYLSCADYY